MNVKNNKPNNVIKNYTILACLSKNNADLKVKAKLLIRKE
jgi:hypothetical protein